MKNIFLPIFLLMFSLNAKPQQQMRLMNNSSSNQNKSETFDNRFWEVGGIWTIEIGDSAFYKARKVKRVEILDENKNLSCFVDLDTNGNVIKKGHQLFYFYTEQHFTDKNKHKDTIVKNYYRASKLLRTDTVINTAFIYNHADTSIKFTRTQLKSYWNGALLNERNDYYNSKYLHQLAYGATSYSKHHQPTKKIFLQHQLKTNFDSTQFYLNNKQTFDSGFIASIGEGKKRYFSPQQLSKLRFVRQYQSKDYSFFYTKGGKFKEPYYYGDNPICGTTIYLHDIENANTDNGFTKNNAGLYETFYSDYYNAKTYVINKNQPGDIKPERRILQYYRYEYYK